jgi:hypothetical protein
MQQGRERDDIVGVLQPRLRDFIFVRAALRDDVMILIAAARTAKSFDEECYIRRVLDEITVARKFLIIATHLKFFEAVWTVLDKFDSGVGIDFEFSEFGNRVGHIDQRCRIGCEPDTRYRIYQKLCSQAKHRKRFGPQRTPCFNSLDALYDVLRDYCFRPILRTKLSATSAFRSGRPTGMLGIVGARLAKFIS